MANELTCSLVTPEGRVYDGRVESVVVPAHDGEIGILRHRAPLVCKLGVGRMRVIQDGQERQWLVDGGFCQVIENRVTVLTQTALSPDQIDRQQAEAMLAEARAMSTADDADVERKFRAESAARARLRLVPSSD